MPRMFDILRNKAGAAPAPEKGRKEKISKKRHPEGIKKAIEETPPLAFPREILKNAVSAKAKTETEKTKEPEDRASVSVKLISAAKKHGLDNQEKTKEIYKGAVDVINALIVDIRNKRDITPLLDRLYGLLDSIFNQVVLGDSILENIYESREGEYYLPYHIVNVLILSTVLGLNMGFNKSRLNHLGLAGIFHDIGMDAVREMVGQQRRLTTEEHSLMKAHISKSLKTIGTMPHVNNIVKETVAMHHERVSGNGYPIGLKSDSINAYAKILGLVDTYEALTHRRPHREVLNTHDAIKFLVDSLKDDFDTEVMKIFINKMSVYPVGSIVRLDTEEIARVIGVQSGSPLRPVVMILRNAFGQAIKERTIIDLSQQDYPSIKEAL